MKQNKKKIKIATVMMTNLITNEMILRQTSLLVGSQQEAAEIIVNLEQELKAIQGIGLAAPQIGIHKQVAIIRHPKLSINIINPEDITCLDDTFIYKNEGCLSFSGIKKNTTRYQTIDFVNNFHTESHHYSVLEGNDDDLVVAVQHEIDHLFGVLFFDHALKPVIKQNDVGRNEPCPCGSGKKFKKCCWNGKN